MKNIDSYTHVRGESIYLDDIPVINGTLYAAVFDSPVAHGKIISLDTREAEKTNGVVRIFTAKDIPGENQIGGIVPDEELLASDHVHFCGMPVALVVAETEEIARTAVKKIRIEIDLKRNIALMNWPARCKRIDEAVSVTLLQLQNQ